MKNFSVAISGFEGDDRFNVSALIRLLGASYTEKFSKKNTHLVCKSPSGAKVGVLLVFLCYSNIELFVIVV